MDKKKLAKALKDTQHSIRLLTDAQAIVMAWVGEQKAPSRASQIVRGNYFFFDEYVGTGNVMKPRTLEGVLARIYEYENDPKKTIKKSGKKSASSSGKSGKILKKGIKPVSKKSGKKSSQKTGKKSARK